MGKMKRPLLYRSFFISFFILLVISYSNLFAQGNSLLWRITGKNLDEPSYFYGTMHTRDPRVFRFADSVVNAFQRCNAFAMEVVIDSSTMNLAMKHVFMSDGTTLRGLLSDAQYDSVDRACIKYLGISAASLNTIKPIYTGVLLNEGSVTDTIKSTGRQFFLDQYFEDMARKQYMPVYGLESADEQFRVLDLMTYPQQAELLMQSLRYSDNDTLNMGGMIGYYLDNDLYQMLKFTNDYHLPDSIYDAFITKRNYVMSNRVDSLIQITNTFVAIGAAHLGGKEGLVELLRNKGYTVVPVIPTYNSYLSDGWYRYSEPYHSWSVDFPQPPEITFTSYESLNYWMIRHTQTEKNRSSWLTIIEIFYTDQLPHMDSSIAEIKRKWETDGVNVKDASEEKITWNGLPAVDLWMEVKENVTSKVRVIQLPDRELRFSYYGNLKSDKDLVDRFFSSFQLNAE